MIDYRENKPTIIEFFNEKKFYKLLQTRVIFKFHNKKSALTISWNWKSIMLRFNEAFSVMRWGRQKIPLIAHKIFRFAQKKEEKFFHHLKLELITAVHVCKAHIRSEIFVSGGGVEEKFTSHKMCWKHRKHS